MERFDLGTYSRAVSTRSPEAQRWFDIGLNWCYGFNHEEAIRCFEKVLSFDPGCAMAHWGIAYAAGPSPMAEVRNAYVKARTLIRPFWMRVW